MKHISSASRIALFAAVLLLAGCQALQGFSLRPYRLNIQQGNFLEARDVDQLQVGMTRSQVRFLIGTPMVADPFNADRWDYLFYFKVGRTRDEVVNHMTVWFEDDRVVKIERPAYLPSAPVTGEPEPEPAPPPTDDLDA